MIDRQSIYYYVGLAVLCLIVVGSVGYLLKTRFDITKDKKRMPDISKPLPSARGGELNKRDPGDITWDKYAEQQPTRPFKTMRKPLNPFLWPEEIEPEKQQVAAVPESVPRLGMIIVGLKNRLAFLDQKPVYEGNQHSGFRVEKIAPKAVTLSYSYGQLQLIAPDDHFGPAKVKRVERSKP